jgi:hypothetical protein
MQFFHANSINSTALPGLALLVKNGSFLAQRHGTLNALGEQLELLAA